MSEWWRGGVIYQVYPRSFCDTNNDGIGDLAGITSKLDYIAELGVDAVWISPFFTSPMDDFGYDVSNYRDVDEIFGTLADFDKLIAKADSLNLKIMIDMVISHTSEQHEWFIKSRSSRDNDKSDWYVWADPQPDGSPPNNWLSIFGGSAWEWDNKRRQYYLHNFLTSQPDLNYHNPEVRQEAMDIAKFWLDRGVKGFRMDTVNFYFHDQQLRSNPPSDGKPLEYVPESNPYSMQQQIYNKSQPEGIPFIEDLRKLMDQYPDTTSVGELSIKDAPSRVGEYTKKDERLHMVYTFNFLTEKCSPRFIRDTIEYLEERIGDGWVCWALSNHDVVRAVTRWNHHNIDRETLAPFLAALLLSLRGSVSLYQGEELGLMEADIPYDKLQDPCGIKGWPEVKGRDGCRTPMPWQGSKSHAGFSDVEPWLPVPADHQAHSVETQHADDDSILHHFVTLLKWRKEQEALVKGSIKFIDLDYDLIGFEREHESTTILAIFNFAIKTHHIDLEQYENIVPMEGHGFNSELDGKKLKLPSYSVFYAHV